MTWRNLGSFSGIKDVLMEFGLGRNTLTDLRQALKMASKEKIPTPKPLPQQSPSAPVKPTPEKAPFQDLKIVSPAMQQRYQAGRLNKLAEGYLAQNEADLIPSERPAPTKAAPEPLSWKAPRPEPKPENLKTPGGISLEAPPVTATRPPPTWITEQALKATKSPQDMASELAQLKKVVSSKSRLGIDMMLKDPKATRWQKSILENLLKDKENAKADFTALEEAFAEKFSNPLQ
jgi:hypothetical protein